MTFWNLDQYDASSTLLIDEQKVTWTKTQVQFHIDKHKESMLLDQDVCVGLILCRNDLRTVTSYLAALQLRHPVILVDGSLDLQLLEQIITDYQPSWISTPLHAFQHHAYHLQKSNENGQLWRCRNYAGQAVLHPQLALLLSTSGTTGSSKMVRLSYENLAANAQSIVQYLGLDETEKAMTTLPVYYSYGLSVLNSHLQARAPIVLSNESIISRPFWKTFHDLKITSIAGVPYMYQMLERMKFRDMKLPSLRYLTQAGGALSTKLIQYFAEAAEHHQARFYVMYGQTEATARMSFVPPERLAEKIGSIGVPIPGGQMHLDHETGEIVYQGPNVMLGYARNLSDLSLGDEWAHTLYTGDIAKVDEEGYYYITGRKNRFVKLFGLRVNLDDVERSITKHFEASVACTGEDDMLHIYVQEQEAYIQNELKPWIQKMYHLHPSVCQIKVLNQLPRTSNGKIHYAVLKDM